MTFLVIPALDLKDRKCVQLEGGDPSRRLIELEDPVEVAKKWEEMGAKRLHLIDLDGAIGGFRKNEEIVKKIVEELQIPIQFGGGIRSIEDARRFLDLGVEKIILGTLAIQDPSRLKGLAEKYGRERIIVALDSKDGYVVIKGWTESTGFRASEIAKKFESYAQEILFTDVNVEGRMSGINEKMLKEVIESSPLSVIVSGGISSVNDISKVRELGAAGVIIGSALYFGKIDPKKVF
jgi:phosphoribosylformimino-5-aminoimidazole carboxamide ribotide isomerase